MLSFNNLSTSKEGRIIWSGASLTVMPNSMLMIQGQNGCGKTTLLEILASLQKPNTGSITFNEVDIYDELATYRSIISYLGIEHGLSEELTALENLKFWCEINSSAEALEAAISFFDLEPFLDFEVYKLSAGWQKKVALAKVMLSNAKIWFLDEPFENLDAKNCEKISRMIASRCEQGGIVVFTSHKEIDSLKKIVKLNLEDFT